LTLEQRRALQMLAAAPYGCMEPALPARGVNHRVVIELASAGYVVAEPGSIRAGDRTFRVRRLVITDAGRRAIG
jgi:hypothetical protein